MSADQTLSTIGATLDEIHLLTKELEERLVDLKVARDAYAGAGCAARAAGVPVPQYSGSAAHAVANNVAPRLIAAGQLVQFVSGELCRASY
jgi:hypothetical protein